MARRRAIRFETLAAAGVPGADGRADAAATRRHSGCIPRAAPDRPKGCVHLQHDMARVCRDLRARRCSASSARDRCFSVAKLFFAYGLGNAMYFPLAVGATSHPVARARHAARRLRHHRALSADAVLLGADALRDAAGAPTQRASSICRASAAPCRPARRCHPRCSSGFAIASASRSSTASARPKSCTSSSPTGLAAFGPGRAGVPVSGYEARLVDEDGRPVARGRDRRSDGQGRFDVCLLLESARADEGHDCRPLDPDRRQVLAG